MAGNSFQCELTSGSTTVFGWAPCTSPQAYDLTGQPDGTYTFSVTQTDPVGNTSTAATSTYTLSTAPVIVSITSAPESPGNSRAPSWSFTAEAGTTTECELTTGSTTIAGWAPWPTSPQSYDLTGQPGRQLHIRRSGHGRGGQPRLGHEHVCDGHDASGSADYHQ